MSDAVGFRRGVRSLGCGTGPVLKHDSEEKTWGRQRKSMCKLAFGNPKKGKIQSMGEKKGKHLKETIGIPREF